MSVPITDGPKTEEDRMKTLEIDESKVKECMKECPEIKKYAEKLWPELKEEGRNVTSECTLESCHGCLHIKHDGEYIGYVTEMGFVGDAADEYEFSIPPSRKSVHVYKK